MQGAFDETEDGREAASSEAVDVNVGQETIRKATSMPCIWDADCEYNIQLELLVLLQRIMEHFSAAIMSLRACKSLDAVSIIVPGCICALADAIIRRRATDRPSEACTHLMGQDRCGRQLGIFGFGIGVGNFATQSESVEIYTPELAVARTAVLDYYDSPLQRRLEKIFSWEEQYLLRPGRP